MTTMGCWLLCVSSLSLGYHRFDGAPRVAAAPAWKLTQGVEISLTLRALDISRWLPRQLPARVYWSNRVHGDMDESQFRLVGWQFEAGVRVGPVDFYRAHHSQHILEGEHPWMRFPVEDAYGVRVHLLGE